MTSQLCAICGLRKASTMDHIPPKSIFTKPRPQNLITIPACFSCNNTASKDDEAFRVFLSLHIGIDTLETKKLWEEGALRSVRHNKRIFNYIKTTMKTAILNSKTGVSLGVRKILRWDSNAHNKTIERMIRGLYFYNYGDIFGNRVTIRVHWLRNLADNIFIASKKWKQESLGGDALIYRYSRAMEDPLHSIWLFQFYGKHWASGYTTPQVGSNDEK